MYVCNLWEIRKDLSLHFLELKFLLILLLQMFQTIGVEIRQAKAELGI